MSSWHHIKRDQRNQIWCVVVICHFGEFHHYHWSKRNQSTALSTTNWAKTGENCKDTICENSTKSFVIKLICPFCLLVFTSQETRVAAKIICNEYFKGGSVKNRLLMWRLCKVTIRGRLLDTESIVLPKILEKSSLQLFWDISRLDTTNEIGWKIQLKMKLRKTPNFF